MEFHLHSKFQVFAQRGDIPLCECTLYELYLKLKDNQWTSSPFPPHIKDRRKVPLYRVADGPPRVWYWSKSGQLRRYYAIVLLSAASLADQGVDGIPHFAAESAYKELLHTGRWKTPAPRHQRVLGRRPLEDDGEPPTRQPVMMQDTAALAHSSPSGPLGLPDPDDLDEVDQHTDAAEAHDVVTGSQGPSPPRQAQAQALSEEPISAGASSSAPPAALAPRAPQPEAELVPEPEPLPGPEEAASAAVALAAPGEPHEPAPAKHRARRPTPWARSPDVFYGVCRIAFRGDQKNVPAYVAHCTLHDHCTKQMQINQPTEPVVLRRLKHWLSQAANFPDKATHMKMIPPKQSEELPTEEQLAAQAPAGQNEASAAGML